MLSTLSSSLSWLTGSPRNWPVFTRIFLHLGLFFSWVLQMNTWPHAYKASMVLTQHVPSPKVWSPQPLAQVHWITMGYRTETQRPDFTFSSVNICERSLNLECEWQTCLASPQRKKNNEKGDRCLQTICLWTVLNPQCACPGKSAW